MALIKCKCCGHMISDRAVKCPKCGCLSKDFVSQQPKNVESEGVPKREENKARSVKWLYAIIVLLLVAIVSVGYGLNKLNRKDVLKEKNAVEDSLLGAKLTLCHLLLLIQQRSKNPIWQIKNQT